MNTKEIVNTNRIEQITGKVISKEAFWIIAFSILTAFAAQVSVPVRPVPFTLQTMMVILSGAFLGKKNGAISQVLYILLGISGIPVFADLSFGIQIVFGPTGGYLLSFPIAAYFVGYLTEKKSNLFVITLSMLLANMFILFTGAAFLSTFFNGDFKQAFFTGVIVFSVWDIIKLAAAVSLYYSISRKYPRLPN